jgi:hypothetical protein
MPTPTPLTYGELADAADKLRFLEWLHLESCAGVLDDPQERNRIVNNWIRHERREMGAALAKLQGRVA